MQTILVATLALSLQGASQSTPLSSLVGKWVTTVKPPPGNAPAVEPSFTITEKNGKVFVTFDRSAEPTEAVLFETGGPGQIREVSLLLLRFPTKGSSARMIMIRPIAPDQVRYELLVETGGTQPGRN